MARQTFINTIQSNNYNKNSKTLKELFRHINESDEYFSYRDFIRRDLHTPPETFGKFFKQSEGIQPHIRRVYFYKEIHRLVENRKTFRKCLICDVQVNGNIFGCYIESNYDEGCRSCGMGRDEDNFMYISYTIETLILCCLSPNSLCFIG